MGENKLEKISQKVKQKKKKKKKKDRNQERKGKIISHQSRRPNIWRTGVPEGKSKEKRKKSSMKF